jgi:omega-hydroxy-beta-dihydromenaquinone-9 sulfotransferase
MLYNQPTSILSDSRPTDAAANRKPYWAPKFWHGMTFRVWLRLLVRNRFAVDFALWPVAVVVTAVSIVNSALALLQWMLFGRKIARTEIREPPIFIIGHWRSGTTLLHRLLVQDDRFAYPTTFDCFAPKSSLVTARFVRRWLGFLHPMRRLMDNMADGFDYPHEDEFALCSMGLESPYVQFAFPNRPQGEEAVDFEGIAAAEVNRWKAGLRWFLQKLTLRTGKPIVLKSPPHTARIRLLLELFPDARFVHIVRHPFAVFPSMVWTRKLNYRAHGLQRPRFEGLEEFVYRNFLRMHRAFTEQRHLIPPGNLCEVRYEDLVRDPLGNMRAIYEQLNLGEFDRVRPVLDAYLAGQKDYQTNRFNVSSETRAEISRRWAEFMREYGYAAEERKQWRPKVRSQIAIHSGAATHRRAA